MANSETKDIDLIRKSHFERSSVSRSTSFARLGAARQQLLRVVAGVEARVSADRVGAPNQPRRIQLSGESHLSSASNLASSVATNT